MVTERGRAVAVGAMALAAACGGGGDPPGETVDATPPVVIDAAPPPALDATPPPALDATPPPAVDAAPSPIPDASSAEAQSPEAGADGAPPPAYLLSADGVTDTYTLLGKALGGTPIDGPDCSHPAFGPHITQLWNAELGRNVFAFHIHATPDNDRCSAFDRQRNEIKVYDPSPAALKGASGDTIAYQWKFRLDAKFQPSPSFCHIHQIKGGDGAGAGAAPVVTITPRHGTPDVLQLIYSSPAQAETILTSVPLAPFLGTWVEASETIHYDATGAGAYALDLRRVSDGAALLSYASSTLVMWAMSTAASPTTYCRPKWGIYRSLKDPTYLRDEDVLFDDFCIAKNGSCPKDLP